MTHDVPEIMHQPLSKICAATNEARQFASSPSSSFDVQGCRGVIIYRENRELQDRRDPNIIPQDHQCVALKVATS